MNGRSARTALAFAGLFLLLSASALAKPITEPGSGAGQTLEPKGLAVDFEIGRLYAADTRNNRVEVFNSSGVLVKEFGTAGAGNGQFNAPTAIAVDNDPGSVSHDIYVVDSDNS